MKLKSLLLFLFALATFSVSYAQEGGIRGKVVARGSREALSNVKVTLESTGLSAVTDKDGNFLFENLRPATTAWLSTHPISKSSSSA